MVRGAPPLTFALRIAPTCAFPEIDAPESACTGEAARSARASIMTMTRARLRPVACPEESMLRRYSSAVHAFAAGAKTTKNTPLR